MKSSFFRQKRICARSKFLLHGFLGMLLLCGFSVSMKTDDLKAEDDANIPREKIYLHIDRNLYNSGEDIWFKVFLVDANTNKPTAQSKVVYVELINPAGKITSTKIIKIAEGGGAGDFKLPFNLIHGAYTVRAYTNYMRNFDEVWFFSKILSISSLQDGDASQVKFAKNQVSNPLSINKPDLQFFPEGGNMVYELVNHIGFNAIGACCHARSVRRGNSRRNTGHTTVRRRREQTGRRAVITRAPSAAQRRNRLRTVSWQRPLQCRPHDSKLGAQRRQLPAGEHF